MLDLEALLQETLPRVRRQAQRLAVPPDPVWDVDDLYQEGAIALLAAFARYDPARNSRLWTYAEIVVTGAMREAKRARFDPVSRSLRRQARRIATAIQVLTHQHGRAPESEEIAHALGLSQETYETWRLAVAGTQSRWSLDYPTGRGGMRDIGLHAFLAGSVPGPAVQAERAQAQRQREGVLARAMALLPANEQQVLRLRYWEELTLKAIGTHLGVTESRASQLHTSALARMRSVLTRGEDSHGAHAQWKQRQDTRHAQALERQDVLRTQGRRAYLRLWRAQQKEAPGD